MPLNIGVTGLNFRLRNLHGTFSAQMGAGVGVILKCVLIEMFHESADDTELFNWASLADFGQNDCVVSQTFVSKSCIKNI